MLPLYPSLFGIDCVLFNANGCMQCRMQCSPQQLVITLHSVLQDVKAAAVLIVQQLLYIHWRKHDSTVGSK